MLEQVIWKDLSKVERYKLLQRPVQVCGAELQNRVQSIVAAVRAGGDVAVKDFTRRYDGVAIDDFKVTTKEFLEAREKVGITARQAMLAAIQRLVIFHQKKLSANVFVETSPGIMCETQIRPIQRVGLYIPGGSAPLVSTVLMLGVPAKIANCPVKILCSPPNRDGKIDPNILVAAKLCGIDQVYKVGGAQAIAAMAYGTDSIPKVDKIFGPGNSYVTQAKMLVAQDSQGAVCDMPAGPSEVMVIADHKANPEFIAADLLSQAEHGVDSQSILISTNLTVMNETKQAVLRQLNNLSRKSIAKQALKNSYLILVDTIGEAIEIANEYAAEHLIIQVDQPRMWLDQIKAAGSVFLGCWSPESAGDYVSGTNHVLPTYGFAKSLSGLSASDFMKTITVQELTKEGLASVAWAIEELTNIEGLDAHAQAVKIRLGGKNE